MSSANHWGVGSVVSSKRMLPGSTKVQGVAVGVAVGIAGAAIWRGVSRMRTATNLPGCVVAVVALALEFSGAARRSLLCQRYSVERASACFCA